MSAAFGAFLCAAAASSAEASAATGAVVPVDGMLVILAHRFQAAPSSTLQVSTTGGLTWTSAFGVQPSTGSIRATLFYAPAPAGLALTTTLGVNCSAGSNDITWTCCYWTGLNTAGTPTATNSTAPGTVAPWASGSVAGNSGDALIGGAGGDGTLRTSTVDAPGNFRDDFNSATSGGSVVLADKLSIAGTDTLDGDWSGTLTHIGLAMAFPTIDDVGITAYRGRMPIVGASVTGLTPGLIGPGTDAIMGMN